MDVWTEGRTYHTGYRIALHYQVVGSASDLTQAGEAGYRIVLIEEGSGIIQINGQAYPLISPGVYCFSNQDEFQLVAGALSSGHNLNFAPGVLNERLNPMLDNSTDFAARIAGTDAQDLWLLEPFTQRPIGYYGCIPLAPSASRHIAELLAEIGANLEHQPDFHWPCRSRSYLMELLFLIRRSYQKGVFAPDAIAYQVPGTVKSVIEYLHTHYMEKIRLEDLTTMFHMNKTTLGEQFKQSTGLSLIAYLNKIRMTMAGSMLRNTTLPTTEIMERVGFRDDGHFIRHFRKYSGYSPAEYRNKYCWMLTGKS